MSEEEVKKMDPVPLKTDRELRQLAMDIVDGKVFGTWNFENERALNDMLTSVFITLIFIRQLLPENLGCVYEYLSEASERSVNGYPCFVNSCRMLAKDDVPKLNELIVQLREQKISFLEDRDIKEESCQQKDSGPTTPSTP